jgi:hypothetical protein
MSHHPLDFQLQPDSHVHVPFVSAPNAHDVMLGRGVSITNWPGNVRFRELIGTWKVEYTQTGRHYAKKAIADRIYQEILRRGGRFLRQIDSTEEAQDIGVPIGAKAWVIVDESVAIRKIKQALREYPAVKPSKRSNQTRLSDSDENNVEHSAARVEVGHVFQPDVPATSKLIPPSLPTGGMLATDIDSLDRKMPRQHSWYSSPDRVEGIKKFCSALQNTDMAGAVAFHGPQTQQAEDSRYQPTQQSAGSDDTRNVCTSDELSSASFERTPLALNHIRQGYSLKQSIHPQGGLLIGYPTGPVDSLPVPAAPREPFEFRRSELGGVHHGHRNGPTIDSTTHPIDNEHDSLISLRTIEEIRASGAAELDESVASLLSNMLSYPANNS